MINTILPGRDDGGLDSRLRGNDGRMGEGMGGSACLYQVLFGPSLRFLSCVPGDVVRRSASSGRRACGRNLYTYFNHLTSLTELKNWS